MEGRSGSVQKSLRIPVETARDIEALGAESGAEFSTIANQLLEEALRMRRCPGIAFTAGPSGRRATVAGTGIDAWEIVATHQSLGGDEARLRAAYHWLTDAQLRAALAYHRLYPAEIDARIAREAALTPDAIATRHPSLAARPVKRSRRRERSRRSR
jgi:uncharacterized protein (DUF433 family)